MRPASKLLLTFAGSARSVDACPQIFSSVQAYSKSSPYPIIQSLMRLLSTQPRAPHAPPPSSTPHHARSASTYAQPQTSSSCPPASPHTQSDDLALPPSILDPTVIATEQTASTVSPLRMDGYKLPYAVMRSAIYENDIHMEHVGELAKFIKIRRAQGWYNNTIESYRTLAVLLGNITRGKMVRYLERARRARLTDRRWAFMSLLESRLDMTLLRIGLAHNIRMAQAWTRHNKLMVNGERVNRVAHEVRPGDVITVAPGRRQEVVNRLTEDLEDFFFEVHGTPALRPVYYRRALQVDDSPGVPLERYQLGLGNLIRKVAQASYNSREADDPLALVTQPNSRFNAERKRYNQQHHPWRLKVRDAARKGSPAAVDEQLRRSFRVMLQQRRGQVAGAEA